MVLFISLSPKIRVLQGLVFRSHLFSFSVMPLVISSSLKAEHTLRSMSPSTNISPLRISNPFINCLLFWCLVRISVLQCPKLAFPSQILSCSSFLCLINDNSILPVAQVNLAFFSLTPYSQSIIVSLLSKYILNTC